MTSPAPRFPVEASHIMMFAYAVGDTNPVYFDPDSDEARAAGGIVAPPTFVTSEFHFRPDFPFRVRAGVPWLGSGGTPTGQPGRDKGVSGLHGEQHYEYHRPLRPGDVLHPVETPGTTWEKETKRGGVMQFSDRIIEWRDENDEPVVTARSVSIRPQRPIES